MTDQTNSQKRWLNLLVMILAFAGAFISVIGSLLVYTGQGQIDSGRLWLLPGLILTYWALMGIAGFLMAYFSLRRVNKKWLQVAWFLDGMFIPLFVLGGFSIGPMVLLAFLLFLGATIVLGFLQKTNWLEGFGLLLLGAVINLGILYLFIALGSGYA